MTEAEWLTCTDPFSMVRFLGRKASERKMRLFVCATLRRSMKPEFQIVWQSVALAEEWVDGNATDEDVGDFRQAHGLRGLALDKQIRGMAWGMATLIGLRPADMPGLLRDIVGNPLHPVTLDPACRTPAVISLATATYEERELPSGHFDSARLGVLADALEDAGCNDPVILGHLRGPGPHYRGCWAVDAVLGKS
jgi:hypothetical protein